LSSLFSQYAQTVLKKLFKGTASPGRNGSAVDSTEHDCLSWLAPSGQLEGPNKDCTRPLRAVMTQAIEKYANQIDYAANGLSNNPRDVKQALKKGLRTRCNRLRNSGRLLAYRTFGVYMDDDVNEASEHCQQLRLARSAIPSRTKSAFLDSHMYVSGWLLCCHEPKYLQDPIHHVLSWPDQDDIFRQDLIHCSGS